MVLGPLREKLLERARQQLGFLDDAGVRPDGWRAARRRVFVGHVHGARGARRVDTVGVELGESTAQAARDRGLDVRTGTLAAVADQFRGWELLAR